jgi:hypothetical protein
MTSEVGGNYFDERKRKPVGRRLVARLTHSGCHMERLFDGWPLLDSGINACAESLLDPQPPIWLSVYPVAVSKTGWGKAEYQILISFPSNPDRCQNNPKMDLTSRGW